jgi:hypothetical protein
LLNLVSQQPNPESFRGTDSPASINRNVPAVP